MHIVPLDLEVSALNDFDVDSGYHYEHQCHHYHHHQSSRSKQLMHLLALWDLVVSALEGGFREANKGNGSPKSALTNQRKGFSKIYLVVLYFTDPSLIRSTRFIAMQFQGQK